ncbi:MltA domain-containing protein [Henriciella sp.]|uniref:murein transglycosylase A n=1 Tax=Henriciella sp. TaxID=1968823 RepID=UPI002607014B|nr:MltA domain-containing protein [Henriciella sp.]
MRASVVLPAILLLLISGCASAPEPEHDAGPVPPSGQPEQSQPGTPDTDTRRARPKMPVPMAPPVPAAFEALPGWQEADLMPGVSALKQSCEAFSAKAADSYLSDSARWAGQVRDWTPACAAMGVIINESSARTVLQALFKPVEIVSTDGASRFTGYFEPVYEARYAPEYPYTEPVPALPGDLVSEGGNNVYQRLSNGSRRPYPAREQITNNGVRPLAYAHPADVFFLQIQGSGKLAFPDGRVMKAAFAAHNGRPFKSTANWLYRRGWIGRGERSMQGIRAWMDRASEAQRREAMNANPRFVFFTLEPREDDVSGPRGAMSVPLTPLGSVAVDRAYHPLGVPVFVKTTAPGLGGDWSGLLNAQDTGGAITGPVRGDIYFGTGEEAGERAGTMNAPGRLWVLLPTRLADRLASDEIYAGLGADNSAP